MMSLWRRMDSMRICITRSGVRRDIFRCFLINSVSNIKTVVSRKLSVHCRFYYDEIRKTVKYTNESVILKNKIDVV